MVLQLSTHSQFPDKVVQEIVQAALKNEAELARFRYEQFVKECQSFEQKFHMTTEEFGRKFDAGELGDAEEFFDWYAAARGSQVWKQKADVLGEVVA
jgi:hypothetical protein